MKEAKTTFNYKGREYPFYDTIRAKWDFEAAGYSNKGLMSGNTRDMVALSFFTVRECARRAGLEWRDSLDEFVDNITSDAFEAFGRLAEEKEKIREAQLRGKLEKLEAKPTPRIAPDPPEKH